ncbi:MAG: fibronectin type III domain-containing protein [Bacillota bacterium]
MTKIYLKIVAIMLTFLFISLPAYAANYTYDNLNRLNSVTYENGQKITYTYDAAGNLLTVTSTGSILDTTPPIWPNGSALTATNVVQTSLTLNWTPAIDNVGISGYQLYQGAALLTTVAGNIYSYNVTGLNSSTAYTFKVEAGDAADNWSNTGPSVNVLTLAVCL